MPKLISVPSYTDDRGSLSVIEKILPFDIKRVFYIYNVRLSRGGHAHKKTRLALICLAGACTVKCNNGLEKSIWRLEYPNQCLILEPNDWHTMNEFAHHSILLVLASHEYDENDYIYEEPV